MTGLIENLHRLSRSVLISAISAQPSAMAAADGRQKHLKNIKRQQKAESSSCSPMVITIKERFDIPYPAAPLAAALGQKSLHHRNRHRTSHAKLPVFQSGKRGKFETRRNGQCGFSAI